MVEHADALTNPVLLFVEPGRSPAVDASTGELCVRLQRLGRTAEHCPLDAAFAALPNAVLQEDPELCVRLAWILILTGHGQAAERLLDLAEAVWAPNWKCFLENYLEGYHLSPLHRDSLHTVNPTRLCRHLPPLPRPHLPLPVRPQGARSPLAPPPPSASSARRAPARTRARLDGRR